jgi:GTP cyclohydrolase II
MHHAERGLFELRRGRLLYVTDASGSSRAGSGQGVPSSSKSGLNGASAPVASVTPAPSTAPDCPPESVLLASVEGLKPETLDTLRKMAQGQLRLILTRHRAQAMGLGEDVGPEVSLGLNGVSRPDEILRLSSATGTLPMGHPDLRSATRAEAAGLTLARLGRLLPAVVAVPVDSLRVPALRHLLESGTVLRVSPEEVGILASEPSVEVTFVSEAPVPLEEAENARFILFRESSGLQEHVAVLIGDRETWPDPVPVRLHSACLTGDLFGSLRCDCGEQLRRSISHFASQGGGVLLYLSQEGRSIGLGNKFRAYTIQEGGLDTVDADCTLGFGADERRYDHAVQMLRYLGIDAIQLLTNNPEKVRAMEEAGIRVLDRKALHGTLNRHNLPYVRAKVHRAGHWLQGMLARGIPGG